MTSGDKLEERLLEDESSGMKDATPGTSIPEVLASLVNKLEKMSNKILNMDSSIERLLSERGDFSFDNRTKQETTFDNIIGNTKQL